MLKLDQPNPRRRVTLTIVAALLAAAIVVWRFLDDDVTRPVLIFLMLPIAIISTEYGAVVGLFGAVAGLLVFFARVYTVGEGELSVLDFSARLVGFVIAGVGLGLLSDANRLARVTAYRDGLTGLYNRRAFWEMMDKHERIVERYGPQGSVIFLDLDDFKRINDTIGHRAGDEALKQVAEILCDRTRRSDIVARLGGDEFAVLLPREGAREADVVAQNISRAIAEHPFVLGKTTWRVTASIGTVAFEVDKDASMIAADKAMYAAKAMKGR